MPGFTSLPHAVPMPVPTRQQLAYQGKISALIHFGMATFFHDGDPGCDAQNWNGCDPHGGCNSSRVASFNPTNLNVSSWVESFQALGATSAVLTAKHGCGFLGWETKTTLPDGTPYAYHAPGQLNVVEQFVAATEAAGIGHGFYYSLTNNFYLNVKGHVAQPPASALPGQVPVTQEQFEQIALAQVAELWTQFGSLTEIWLDGGCGPMCDRVGRLVNKTKAAGAVAFNGGGVSASPVRWCGTESGAPHKGPGGAVWSTTDCRDGWCGPGSGSGAPPNASGSMWYPSGVGVTLQQGDRWFFTPGAALNPLATLVDFYHNSVGANGHLEIDFAIDRTGGIAPTHAAAYRQFGRWIRSCYGAPVAAGALAAGRTSMELRLPAEGPAVDRVRLEEDQSGGQRIVDYVLEARAAHGGWQRVSSGTTVGATRIDRLKGVVAAGSTLRFSVVTGFGKPRGLTLAAFAPGPCALEAFAYDTGSEGGV